ncbi:peptide ABC transporter substrate-binding protein [Candidatus Falkowbacteria bacterium]|nr:peptide ABC transporter substrate-binding protein [Candidatus Falkowbacteria bacterium]
MDKFLSFQLKIKARLAKRKTKRFHSHDEYLVRKLRMKKRLPSWPQLKLTALLLSPLEKIIIRILSGLIIIALASFLINFYWTHSELLPKNGGSYTEALVGSPRYLNPLYAQGNDVDLDLTTLMFAGLFKFTNKGLEKNLVENYEVSNDQLTYTLRLRQDALWHDGEKLTADDVIFTFARVTNNKSKTPLYFNFQGINVEKVDDYAIRFTLKTMFAPFLESLTVGILPEHVWKNILPENMMLAEYNLKPIGSGPYEFQSFLKNKNGKIKSYQLVRNEKYYAGVAHIEELTFKFHDNFEQAVESLNNKKVDGLSYLPKEIRGRIINNRNLNFNLLQLPQYTAVFFNYDKNPILKDLTLRKILSHAVNKEKIVNEILNAEAQIIDGPILPGALGYNAETVKFPFNAEHARNELEKLGWKLTEYKPEKKEEDKSEKLTETEAFPYPVRQLKNRYLEFSLTAVNQPESVKIAKELQKDWQQIGAKVNLNLINTETAQNIINEREYETLLYGQILGYDPDPFPFWHSSQKTYPGLNFTSLNHPDVDKLLEDARKIGDDKARAEKYKKFQALIAESVPAIFLFNPTYTYPQNKKIKGFNIKEIIVPANRFNQINEWYIKTKREWK